VTYYVLFFIHLETRRVTLVGITRHPDAEWMQQMVRNASLEDTGYLKGCRYVLHDRDPEVLQRFPQDPCGRRHRLPSTAGPQPQSELLRGTLGSLGQE
jgi:hypothetical protein